MSIGLIFLSWSATPSRFNANGLGIGYVGLSVGSLGVVILFSFNSAILVVSRWFVSWASFKSCSSRMASRLARVNSLVRLGCFGIWINSFRFILVRRRLLGCVA